MNALPKMELEGVLKTFETQLESPVVPGDLLEWLQATEQVTVTLVPVLRKHIEKRHRESLAQIAKQDQGLLTRVEHLKAEDHKLLDLADTVSRMVVGMAEHSRNLEPDESRADHGVEKIVNEGLDLVIRVRKQEAAIKTWLMEAFERDRGDVD